MTGSPRYPGTDGGEDTGSDSSAGTPRWMTIAVVALVVVVVLAVVLLHATGAIGPGLHGSR